MKTSGLQLDTNNVFHNASVIEYTDQGHSEKLTVVYPRNATPFMG